MDKNGKKPAFDHRVLESGWRKKWQEQGLYRTDISGAKKPYYNLMMYPYPSAEGLHVGNMYAFTGSDIWGRYMRMRGYDVFEPIGVDSGGIHSENFAIKMGAHPKKMTAQNISNFVKQLHKIGNMYDWEHFVDAMDPSYYRGTQWLFVQLFKAGLAEKKKSIVTWCPSCKTTLSDEQTEMTDDRVICERCKTPVEKRQMKQWFFKITKYADRLLNNLPQLDWTPKVKLAQQNWIGRTYGIEIKYDIVLSDPRSKSVKRSWIEKPAITCFTTRPDTNFGATFIVAAPEHRIVQEILNPKSEIRNKFQISNDQITQITKYIEKTKSKSEQERIAEGREKTGVFTGLYAINQLNGKKLPIWISDFVLGHVGTGAVVGVPGHDKRDFEFAQKFGLEIIRVVVAKDGDTTPITSIEQVQEQEGTMINSGFLNGLDIHQATTKIMDYLEQKGWGKRKTAYKLRDWCISRQRYWGPPIPMIFCPNCAEKGLSWHTTEEAKSRRQFSNTGCWKSLTPGVLLGGANSQLDNLTIRNYAGYYPVPESELPVLLPDINDYLPDGSGKAPLARHPEFYETKCPHCGSAAERETDVSDTFLDSAWYFLRYPSVDLNKKLKIINKIDNSKFKNSLSARGGSTFGGKIENCKLKISNSQFDNSQFAIPWNHEVTKRWLPVNKYIGGAEHSVLHLMYSRFITMALHDMGYLSFEEPFTSFYAHGLLIKDGAKMSKSKGNVVNPDEYIDRFGADALRCYLMFLGPLSGGGDFRDAGMQGMRRFLLRVDNLVNNRGKKLVPSEQSESRDALYHRHSTIKRVTEGIERYKYNTSIAALMEWVNWLEDKIGSPPSKTPGVKDFQHPVLENWRRPKSKQGRSLSLGKDRPLPNDLRTLLLLLAPFAPYMTEELWLKVNNSQLDNWSIRNSIHTQPWPSYDEKYLQQDEVEIIVQVNGKLRDRLKAKSDKLKAKEEIIERAKKLPKIQTYFRTCHPELACPPKRGVSGSDFKIQKAIYIEGKLVNLVV